jgi:hypothetical protein
LGDLEQNRTSDIAESGHIRIMDMEAGELTIALLAVGKELTLREFTTLFEVGNARVNGAAPAIPAERSARIIALGYMVDTADGLRLTTLGRIQIAAEISK